MQRGRTNSDSRWNMASSSRRNVDDEYESPGTGRGEDEQDGNNDEISQFLSQGFTKEFDTQSGSSNLEAQSGEEDGVVMTQSTATTSNDVVVLNDNNRVTSAASDDEVTVEA